MAIRGEIFSSHIETEKRTYFFNVKENRMGNHFLNLVESTKMPDGSFDRHSIMVYEEDVDNFMHELAKAARILSKDKKNFSSSDNFDRHSDRHDSERDYEDRDKPFYKRFEKSDRSRFDRDDREERSCFRSSFRSRHDRDSRSERSGDRDRRARFSRKDSDRDTPRRRLKVRVRKESETSSMDE